MATKKITHDVSITAILKVVAVLALAGVVFALRELVLVVLTAVVIAAALEPGIRWFVKHRVPRVVAVIAQYFFIAVALSLLFYFLILPLVNETANLIRSLPDYISSAEELGPDAGGPVGDALGGLSVQDIATQVNDTLSSLSRGLLSTLSTVFGGVLSFFLIIVISFYLSVQERGIAKFLTMITPLDKRQYVLSLWNRSEQKIGKWMQGQLILAAIVFVLVYVILLAFHVEHALLLAALAGAFEIIPMFGPVLAAIPGVVVAYLGGGFSIAVVIAIMYFLVQQLENQVIYPLVVRKVVGVPPMVSILALLAGGKLLGFLGLVIAVPVAAVLMEFFGDIERKRLEEEERLGVRES